MGIKQKVIKGLTVLTVAILMINTTFAQEDKLNKMKITLESAITSALSREEKVKVLEQRIEAYEEQIKYIKDYASPLYYSTKYAQDSVIQQKELLSDSVAYKVTVLYNAMIMLYKQIELNKLDIEIAEKELKQIEIKHQKGQSSEFSVDESKASLEKKQAQKNQNQLKLEDYKNQFFNVTHIQIEDAQDLEEHFIYEPIDNFEALDRLVRSRVDYYLKNTETYIAYQKDNIIDYTQYKYGVYTGIPEDILKTSKAEVAQSSYDMNQQKKTMIESLQSREINLESLQQTIVLQEKEIINQRTQFKTSQIRYEYGYISLLDFQKIEQGIQQLELAYIQNIYNYQQEKMILEKPWVQY